jgi:hypothetical protein
VVIATIVFAATGAVLAAFSSTKAKVCSAATGAIVVALTGIRAQVFLADKDSAEAIRAGLIDYRESVTQASENLRASVRYDAPATLRVVGFHGSDF